MAKSQSPRSHRGQSSSKLDESHSQKKRLSDSNQQLVGANHINNGENLSVEQYSVDEDDENEDMHIYTQQHHTSNESSNNQEDDDEDCGEEEEEDEDSAEEDNFYHHEETGL